jgi:pimeloyl-ACP methyl ester carboxylesterase
MESRTVSAPAVKSTNVRINQPLRGFFGMLGRTSPGLAAALAERLFFTPPRDRNSRDAALGAAEPMPFTSNGIRLAGWRWGQGPAVALLHGWGGRAAQLASFVSPLVERGFCVVAFDAPGHGRSGGRLSSAPQFARALQAAAERVGPLHGVVAHSLGATAAALALRDGLGGGRAVFLGPAADPPAWAAIFARGLGLTPAVTDRMRARSERRLGLRWRDLAVASFAGQLAVPLLVVHDRDDAEVPLQDGAAIAAAWPGAQLLETSGLGHYRILRAPAVVDRAVAFIAEGAACGSCGRPAVGGGPCEACRLERELFERDTRWVAPASSAAPRFAAA